MGQQGLARPSPTVGPVGEQAAQAAQKQGSQAERRLSGGEALMETELPDADNDGARGRGLKPEAPAWYFKRPEWLWSQLSINRCAQSGQNTTQKEEEGRKKILRR